MLVSYVWQRYLIYLCGIHVVDLSQYYILVKCGREENDSDPYFPGPWWTKFGLKSLVGQAGNIRSSDVRKPSRGQSSSLSTSQEMSLLQREHNDDKTSERELNQEDYSLVPSESTFVMMGAGRQAAHSDLFPSQRQHSRVCPICGKSFDRREYFQDHMNMHNGIKAHRCSNCGREFTYKRNLWQHGRDSVCFKNKNLWGANRLSGIDGTYICCCWCKLLSGVTCLFSCSWEMCILSLFKMSIFCSINTFEGWKLIKRYW